jgi:hypothetical protein
MLIKDIMRPKPSPPSFENRSFSAEKPEISCIQTDPYAAGVLGCAPGGMQAFLSGKELVCDREHTGAERMQHTAKSATALYSCEYGGWVGIPLSSAASIKAGAKLHSSFDSWPGSLKLVRFCRLVSGNKLVTSTEVRLDTNMLLMMI